MILWELVWLTEASGLCTCTLSADQESPARFVKRREEIMSVMGLIALSAQSDY